MQFRQRVESKVSQRKITLPNPGSVSMPTINRQRAKRVATSLLMVTALFGLGALGWFAMEEGKHPQTLAELPLIQADSAPFKVTPDDPGGMKIPNTDKSIYNVISTQQASQEEIKATITQTSEEPLSREKIAEEYPGKIPEALPPAPAETATVEQEDITVTVSGKKHKVVHLSGLPQRPAQKRDTAEAVEEVAVAVADEAPEETLSEIAPAAAVPQFWVQLGSFTSNDSLERGWERLQKRFPEVAAKEHRATEIDLRGKGVFYRLHVGPFSSDEDATTFCDQMKTQQQGCFLVR